MFIKCVANCSQDPLFQKAKVKKREEHGDEDDTCLVYQLRVRQLDPLPSQENKRMIIEGGYRTVLS